MDDFTEPIITTPSIELNCMQEEINEVITLLAMGSIWTDYNDILSIQGV